MKRISLLLLAVLVFCMALPTAFAKGEPTATTANTQDIKTQDTQEPPQTTGTVSFKIDNRNVYEGMDKAYQKGYTPAVKNGIATIILPLTASSPISGNEITATPNLGDTSGSPFVYKNYQTTFAYANQPVAGGQTAGAYLVRFDLPLKSGRINGVYPVTVDIRAMVADGSAIEQSFTAYVTVKDGKNPSTSASAPATPKPTPQPKVIVKSYKTDPSPAVAGAEFSAVVTLKNTNEKKYVQNMTVEVTSDCPGLTVLNDSSTFYIKKIGKGGTTDIELKLKSDLATPPKRYTVTLTIGYDNAEATALTAAGTFPIEIIQPLRVEMQPIEIASEVNAGDTFPLSFQVMNLGRGMVYNVRCEINVPGIITNGAAFIGNMEAGTDKKADLNAFIGTLDMNGGSGKYGLAKGNVKLVYEDEAGKEYTKDMALSTTIKEPVVVQQEEKKEVKPEMAGQWWISLLIAAALIATVSTILFRNRKRRVKRDEDV